MSTVLIGIGALSLFGALFWRYWFQLRNPDSYCAVDAPLPANVPPTEVISGEVTAVPVGVACFYDGVAGPADWTLTLVIIASIAAVLAGVVLGVRVRARERDGRAAFLAQAEAETFG